MTAGLLILMRVCVLGVSRDLFWSMESAIRLTVQPTVLKITASFGQISNVSSVKKDTSCPRAAVNLLIQTSNADTGVNKGHA